MGSKPAEGTAAHPPGIRSCKRWRGEWGIAVLEIGEGEGRRVLAEVAASPSDSEKALGNCSGGQSLI